MRRLGSDLLTKLFNTEPTLSELFDELKNEQGDIYLVGGAVRDLLLGKNPNDIDIVLSGDVEKSVSRLAKTFSSGGFFALDKKRNYYRLTLRAQRPVTMDFTPVEGGSIKADLGRRDFTINAMGIDLRSSEFIDPYGGRNDIEKLCIQMVAEKNLPDDPLRLLRAFRFLTLSGFNIDADTKEAVKKHGTKITQVAGERIGAEFLAILRSGHSAKIFREMHNAGMLRIILPELTAGENVTQNEWHHLDVLDHSLESLRNLETIVASLPDYLEPFETKIYAEFGLVAGGGYSRLEIVKLATLLHDIGKVPCRKIVDGRIRFIGHDKTGAEMSVVIGDRLKLPKSVTQSMALMVAGHLRPFNAITNNKISDRAVFRFIRDLRGFHICALLLAVSDSMATCGKLVTHERQKIEESVVINILSDQKSIAKPLVTGGEIMEITNIGEGKEIGIILEKIAELYSAGKIRNREEALEFVELRRN